MNNFETEITNAKDAELTTALAVLTLMRSIPHALMAGDILATMEMTALFDKVVTERGLAAQADRVREVVGVCISAVLAVLPYGDHTPSPPTDMEDTICAEIAKRADA